MLKKKLVVFHECCSHFDEIGCLIGNYIPKSYRHSIVLSESRQAEDSRAIPLLYSLEGQIKCVNRYLKKIDLPTSPNYQTFQNGIRFPSCRLKIKSVETVKIFYRLNIIFTD